MNRAGAMQRRWLFHCLLISFCAIYIVYYPATYSILDECNTLQLSYSLSQGTIFPDHAGPGAGLWIDGHRVSKFSIVHTAMMAPAWKLNWRLSFLLAAAFFVLGAFVIRAWLERERLNGDWSALYFFLAGTLYYTQTVMAAVPSAVTGLFGLSLLMRESPRAMLAGFMLGASVLLHPWMMPFVAVASAVWLLERSSVDMAQNLRRLLAGALLPILMMGIYNFETTGSPFRNVYTMLGHQRSFTGLHFTSYFMFYVASLAIFPLAGWAVFSPRLAGGWALPIASATALILAALYYYRDGLNISSAQVGSVKALLAGAIPGQRFIIPISMVACIPAARLLDSFSVSAPDWIANWARPFALAGFVSGFALLSAAHQSYLRAHAAVQAALCQTVPANAPVTVSDELLKEMGPDCKVYERVVGGTDGQTPAANAYVAWLGTPGERPPARWIEKREAKTFQLRSWIWNRDLWIARPLGAAAFASGDSG
ncbi:MAG: hypothetical protein Q7S58_04240 [Candidatus Binatus sp.]|uniref:hypothetical protein n=1 Tax=Candidatus Binatus sp. TaxID=2811406 RepID=UPI002718E0BF|nr:hypothetical protein [Candidatus Binatus sp.]MDO8431601.1 hypothetical protein [Candidatus Binatus sp.]